MRVPREEKRIPIQPRGNPIVKGQTQEKFEKAWPVRQVERNSREKS